METFFFCAVFSTKQATNGQVVFLITVHVGHAYFDGAFVKGIATIHPSIYLSICLSIYLSQQLTSLHKLNSLSVRVCVCVRLSLVMHVR